MLLFRFGKAWMSWKLVAWCLARRIQRILHPVQSAAIFAYKSVGISSMVPILSNQPRRRSIYGSARRKWSTGRARPRNGSTSKDWILMEKNFPRRHHLSIKPLENLPKLILPAKLHTNNSNYWKAEILIKITYL